MGFLGIPTGICAGFLVRALLMFIIGQDEPGLAVSLDYPLFYVLPPILQSPSTASHLFHYFSPVRPISLRHTLK